VTTDTRTIHTLSVTAPGRPGHAPLTWGQRQVYRDMFRAADGRPYNDVGGALLPPGLDLDTVFDVLVELVRRHESLRTTFGPGPSGGGPVQRVAASGTLHVEVVDLPDLPRDALFSLVMREDQRLMGTRFNLDSELLLRPVVFRHRGTPSGVSLAVPKIVADLSGLRLLVADLVALAEAARDGRAAPAPPVGRQPFDQALFEQSSEGRRVGRSSLRRIRKELEAFPADLFTASAEPMPQRYWRGGITSRALPLAVGALAARHRTSTTVVLLAAAVAVLGHTAGRPDVGLQLISRNRHDLLQRDVVSTVVQNVPATFRVGGSGFSELVRTTWSAAMRAYRGARFDLADMAEAVREVERSRGEAIDLDCYFNDTRADQAPRPEAVRASAERIREAQADTEFQWEEHVEHDALSVFVEVFDQPTHPELMRLCLYVDTARVAPGLARRMLLAVERLLVEAVERDLSPAEVAALAAVEPREDDRHEAEYSGTVPRRGSWRTGGTE